MKRSLLLFATLFLFGADCSEPSGLDDDMRTEILTLFENGATFEDPYVRAETVRVISEMDAPELVSITEGMTSDPSPMVRVAVLRSLIALNSESARSLALNGFTNGKRIERKAILEAVYEYGDAPLKAELTARALRSKSDELKRIAFENGHLQRIDDAIKAGNKKLLERTLFPELGRFVTEKDPQLASLALRKLIQSGEGDRAAPLIAVLQNPKAKKGDKLTAAKILSKAGVEAAQPAFLDLIAQHQAALDDTSLGVPDKIVPPAVLRWAYLGLASSGDESYVSAANKYRIKATISQSNEVLEALAFNGSEDSSIAIRNAMKDARPEVRQRAIELYAGRKDADPQSLNDALSGADHDTHVRISRVLIERFLDAWIPMLKKKIKRVSEIDVTLRFLRSVVTSKDDALRVLQPIRAELTELSTAPKEERAQLARYLLALADVDKAADPELLAKLDSETLYAFLEFAGKAAPSAHQEVFRRYFYGDLFAIRLASAAGLWRSNRTTKANEPAGTNQ